MQNNYCEYCGQTKHLVSCPKYKMPYSNYICCYCNEGIYSGEQYLMNCDGQYIHRDCIPCTDFLIDWLGYEVKEMEDEE